MNTSCALSSMVAATSYSSTAIGECIISRSGGWLSPDADVQACKKRCFVDHLRPEEWSKQFRLGAVNLAVSSKQADAQREQAKEQAPGIYGCLVTGAVASFSHASAFSSSTSLLSFVQTVLW